MMSCEEKGPFQSKPKNFLFCEGEFLGLRVSVLL